MLSLRFQLPDLGLDIKKIVDFATIHPQKDSFIGDNLKQQIADLLFSAEFNGEPGYIYLLLEHKSTPDKLMPFRMFKYMFSIMEQHLKKSKKQELPLIYPLIFYTGSRNYNHSTDIFDLFGDNKQFAMKILWQPCQLIDLAKIPDEKLKEALLSGFFARIMKSIHEKNWELFVCYLKDIMKDIEKIKNVTGDEYIYATLSYITEIFDVSQEELTGVVKENLPFISEDNIMTLAERWKEEGYQKGQIEGIEQARFEKEEALKNISIKLFSQGMDVDQIAVITGLSIIEVEVLTKSKI